jgi:hypothetical protein
MPTINEWISDRREMKEIDRDNKRLRKQFKKNHHYDEDRQQWVRNVDGAIFRAGVDGETYYIAPAAKLAPRAGARSGRLVGGVRKDQT